MCTICICSSRSLGWSGGVRPEEDEGAYQGMQEKPFYTIAQPSWLKNPQKEALKSISFLSSEIIHLLGFAGAKLLFCRGSRFVKVSLVPTDAVLHPVPSAPTQGSERSL